MARTVGQGEEEKNFKKLFLWFPFQRKNKPAFIWREDDDDDDDNIDDDDAVDNNAVDGDDKEDDKVDTLRSKTQPFWSRLKFEQIFYFNYLLGEELPRLLQLF